MENNFDITIRNKTIFDFYKNSTLDFESVNLLFVDILRKLMTELDSSLNSNLANKLLDKFNMLDSKIETIGNNINKTQTELLNDFTIKLSQYRKEYLEDFKLILSSNNADSIAPLIRDINSNLLDKTSLMMNDLLPKNQDKLSKDLETNLQLFKNSIMTETTKLLSSSLDKTTIENFLSGINNSFGQSQQTLTTLISSSESRIENRLLETERKMNEIKEISTENNSSQLTLQNNVSEILKKFEKGSTKGNISEHITYNILLSLFPCSQIDHVGNEQKETGDIILIRNNKPKILIENKDHDSKNVPKQEVDKFIRDCEIQDCCGIMLAQHRGIANKQNFELQINNGNVLLYVHEVNFDNDKIKTAIEIVEHFKIKLDEITTKDDNCTINKDVLEEINKEYINYVTQKNNMIKLLKDFNEKLTFSLNDLKMPSLEKYLSYRFAFSSNQGENICKYCEKVVPKSMLQHYRYCTFKRDFDIQNGIQSNYESNISGEKESEIEEIETNIVHTPVVILEKSDKKQRTSKPKSKPKNIDISLNETL
jgi:hypothetical protein